MFMCQMVDIKVRGHPRVASLTFHLLRGRISYSLMHVPAWLAHGLPGTLPPLPPSTPQEHRLLICTITSSCRWVLGMEIQVLICARQVLCPPEPSPSPSHWPLDKTVNTRSEARDEAHTLSSLGSGGGGGWEEGVNSWNSSSS